MGCLFNWYLEASKHTQDSKIAYLQNTIPKLFKVNRWLNEDRNASEVSFPLPLFSVSLVPPFSSPSAQYPSPLYPPLPHSNSLTELPFFSEPLPAFSSLKRTKTCPFKIRPSENPNAKPLISYVPWTKAELQAVVKDFPQVTEGLHRFAEEFNIVIQTCQPGFSDLYQSVHMLVAEGQAQHWMKTASWDDPEKSLELQLGDKEKPLLPYSMIKFRKLPGKSIWQFLGLSQRHSMGIRSRIVPRSPVSVWTIISAPYHV